MQAPGQLFAGVLSCYRRPQLPKHSSDSSRPKRLPNQNLLHHSRAPSHLDLDHDRLHLLQAAWHALHPFTGVRVLQRFHVLLLCVRAMHELRCCCGRTQCAFLAHNHNILQDLERDVHEAGKAGQALLGRHEQYVAESTQERERLLVAMETLEKNKEELEASNARIINENRGLLDQLEEVNNAVAESDLHITSLKTTLESTQHELQRLNSLAHKAAQLEMELTTLEAERAKMDTELATNQQDQKSAVQRWKKAESTIGHLQDQIDSMEKEARDDRERHEDVLSRMERQRTVNLHLSTDTAAARASGVAHAARDEVAGGGVVTHFVKDILQDNSNLQLGILELKELLLASNSEVTSLRAQLDYHQPAAESNLEPQSLDEEIKATGPSESALETVPELHVHHHYHQQRQLLRKPRKRRPALPMGHLLRFPISTAVEGHDRRGSRGYSSTAATILSNTSVSIPAGHRSRWSMQSTATESSYAPSSLSTSPRHPGSVFDSFDAAFDSTRPTTPSSSAPGSPLLMVQADTSPDCSNESCDLPSFSPFLSNHLRQHSYLGDIMIPEEQESVDDSIQESAGSETVTPKPSRRELRRVMSHESLLSISGMDIHAPSRSFSSVRSKNPLSLVTASSSVNAYSTPTITSTTAVSSTYEKPVSTSTDLAKLLMSKHSHQDMHHTDESKSFGKRVGGWVFGKWGTAPSSSASVDNLRARANENDSSQSFEGPQALFRSPGINQPGPIFGMPKPQRMPSNVCPEAVNEDLLKESLEQY